MDARLIDSSSGSDFGGDSIHPAKLMANLNQYEVRFMELVRSWNVDEVEHFIENHENEIDLNCQDHRGLNALHEAVDNNDEAMVEYLVSLDGLLIRDEVLRAVKNGSTPIVTLLLDRLRATYGEETKMPSFIESSEFPKYITPIILAAHSNNYEMVGVLLNRKHTIERPHLPDCKCGDSCSWRKSGESLTYARRRLSHYRALASPAWMAHMIQDPILYAFRLCVELRQCAEIENEWRLEYLALAQQCSQFSADLLSCCHNSAEVETILNAKEGAEDANAMFPRAFLAVYMEQKEFTAHLNVQLVLNNAWLGHWSGLWKRLTLAGKLMRFLRSLLFLPIMAFLYLLFPDSKLSNSMKTPIVKFLLTQSAYFLFLILLALQIGAQTEKDLHGPPNTGYEIIIILFVLGFLLMELQELWSVGFKLWAAEWWNVFDMIMLLMFTTTFALWFAAYVDATKHDTEFLERKYWDSLDPILLSQGSMSFAVLFAYSRILYVFKIHYTLGPLMVTFGYMFKDIAVFMLLFVLVFLAFALAMIKIYHYYEDIVPYIPRGILTFYNVELAFRNLYMAVYGLVPSDATMLGRFNLGTEERPVYNHHIFQEVMGYLFYYSWLLISIVVLMNLLVAMLATSFQDVQNNADTEWKFARTQVWLTYFKSGGVLPPPFNLIPSPKDIANIGSWFVAWLVARRVKFSIRKGFYFVDEPKETEISKDYLLFTVELIKRYYSEREKQTIDDAVKQSDIEVIEHQLRELSQLVESLSKQNGELIKALGRTSNQLLRTGRL